MAVDSDTGGGEVKGTVGVMEAAVAFVMSRDFAVNFFANLGGALFGVLLAFWIERRIARRTANRVYAALLSGVQSEVSYLGADVATMVKILAQGKLPPRPRLELPATRALLINSSVYERPTIALVNALTRLEEWTGYTREYMGGNRLPEAEPARGMYLASIKERVDILIKIQKIAAKRIVEELVKSGIKAKVDVEDLAKVDELTMMLKAQGRTEKPSEEATDRR